MSASTASSTRPNRNSRASSRACCSIWTTPTSSCFSNRRRICRRRSATPSRSCEKPRHRTRRRCQRGRSRQPRTRTRRRARRARRRTPRRRRLIRVLAGRRRTPLTELCRAVEDRHGVQRGYRSRRPTTARQRRGHRAAAAAAAGNRAQTSPRRRRRRLPGRRLRLPIRRARRRRLPGRRAIIGGGADGRGPRPNLMTCTLASPHTNRRRAAPTIARPQRPRRERWRRRRRRRHVDGAGLLRRRRGVAG